MKKVTKEVLIEASHKLLFDLTDEELDKLLNDFNVILEQIDLMSQIDGLDDVEPMVFPYPVYSDYLREDVVETSLSQEEALKNAKEKENGMIKIPKVVR